MARKTDQLTMIGRARGGAHEGQWLWVSHGYADGVLQMAWVDPWRRYCSCDRIVAGVGCQHLAEVIDHIAKGGR